MSMRTRALFHVTLGGLLLAARLALTQRISASSTTRRSAYMKQRDIDSVKTAVIQRAR